MRALLAFLFLICIGCDSSTDPKGPANPDDPAEFCGRGTEADPVQVPHWEVVRDGPRIDIDGSMAWHGSTLHFEIPDGWWDSLPTVEFGRPPDHARLSMWRPTDEPRFGHYRAHSDTLRVNYVGPAAISFRCPSFGIDCDAALGERFDAVEGWEFYFCLNWETEAKYDPPHYFPIYMFWADCD